MSDRTHQHQGLTLLQIICRRCKPAGAATALIVGLSAMWSCAAVAQTAPAGDTLVTFPTQDALIGEAREALKRRDKSRLEALRDTAQRQAHPLAPWVDYWHLGLRLGEVGTAEVERFYQRWPGSYVEDRLRNDWLLELGHRRAWADFAHDMPRFKMNDDREVTCYALVAEHELGRAQADLRERALAAWLAQREADNGCKLMGRTLVQAKVLSTEAAWRKLQLAIETNRPKVARQSAESLGTAVERAIAEITDNATKALDAKRAWPAAHAGALAALALARRAQDAPDDAAKRLETRWARQLSPEWLAWTWAQIGRQAGFKGMPEASQHYRRAWEAADRADKPVTWSDDTLAWGVRTSLRAADALSTRLILRSVDAMSDREQKDPAWQFWRARALLQTARSGADGQLQREQAHQSLQRIASPLHFYGKLALEELGQPLTLPPKPTRPNAAEREAALQHPGLTRALRLLALGLRHEGVREWNFSLRGMNDRDLLAAADRACEREIWDRCINTSDRTRQEIDLDQRFPTPFRRDVLAKTGEIGLDPAYVYGLIRQESRFVTDARSHVGASGLMQVMPATAKWTAKRIGLPFKPEMITDRDANLRIGTAYLKIVLDDFGGSQAMAAAAYNAGPSRPRRWREGQAIEAAAWAESIPFNETRDYVKKVLSNATLYAAMMGQANVSLKARLGSSIGPREAAAPTPDRDIP
ncbi:MAG: lytic transglycosylase domain-containing protein [Betaproteobacteria bacterium]|jgi:soluble lytic murein transglycosylase|nr:lytic transglycosylase domain-containing protein [Betaproteobacteria bacterium]NBU50178.1 lytic transglycosylase domain-containing protein [Betaproteobacteria bacterium]NBX95720.1 lytic transglycosylase domain-containing protein [Betaproteobacteria bacterium]